MDVGIAPVRGDTSNTCAAACSTGWQLSKNNSRQGSSIEKERENRMAWFGSNRRAKGIFFLRNLDRRNVISMGLCTCQPR